MLYNNLYYSSFVFFFFFDIHVLRKTPIIPRGGRMELPNGGDGWLGR